MEIRTINDAILLRVIEKAEIRNKDEAHLWIHMYIDGRPDNLICAAVAIAGALIVKTVMINWTLEDER